MRTGNETVDRQVTGSAEWHLEVGGRGPQPLSSAGCDARRRGGGARGDEDHEQQDHQRGHHGEDGGDVGGVHRVVDRRAELGDGGEVGRLGEVDPDLALRCVAHVDGDDGGDREHEGDESPPGDPARHTETLVPRRCGDVRAACRDAVCFLNET
jgi:hypothetical protein